MKLFEVVRNFFAVPEPCSHALEIHDLKNQLQAEKLRAQIADRNLRKAEHDLEVALSNLNIATTAGNSLAKQLDEERSRHETLREQLVETASALEEANARIAVLETEQRAATDEQAALIYSPVEKGGAPPAADEEVISDTTIEAAYRLVGVFFEGRHHWHLARGENDRIKAPIHDKAFLDRMNRREVSFTPGDTLLAIFHVITFRTESGDVYADYTVEKVVDVIHADQQLELPQGKEEARETEEVGTV